jgi:5'-nucleotidase
MRILIANDDGVYSPGLLCLAEVAAHFGEVRIVAPDHEQSSMGHAITAARPLHIRKVRIAHFDAFRVNGTPADCVALGIHSWDNRCDAVLSGINLGYNLGNSMWHSGTLAAAKQAALFGVRGIALSAPPLESVDDYDAIRPYAQRCLKEIFEAKAAPLLVNVNFPERPQGVTWTRQSVRHYDGKIVPGKDPYGQPHFWFTAMPIEGLDPETDRAAIDAGLATMTPLRLDLTDHATLAKLDLTVRRP